MVVITLNLDIDRTLGQIDAISAGLADAVTEKMTEAAARIVAGIQDDVSEAYPPASMPGEPPRLRTGALLRSVRIEEVVPLRVTIAAGGIGSFAPYARHLEFGTSRMEPRPFVMPRVEEALPDLSTEIRDAVNQHLEASL